MGGHFFAAGGGAAGRGGGAAGRGGGATAIRGGGGGAGRATGGGGAGRAAATGGGAGRGGGGAAILGGGAAILGGGADTRGGGADTRGGGGGVGLATAWGRDGGGATWVTGGGGVGRACAGDGAGLSRRAGFSTGCTLACDCAGGDGTVGLASPGFAGALATFAGLARSWTFGRAPPAGGAFDGVVGGVSFALAGCELLPGLAPATGLVEEVGEDVPVAAVPFCGPPLIAGAFWPGTGKAWPDGGLALVSALLGAVAVLAGLALPPAVGAVAVTGAPGAPGFVAALPVAGAAPPVPGAPCVPVTVVPPTPGFAAALPVGGVPVGVLVAALPAGAVLCNFVFRAAAPALVVGSTETVLGTGALFSWIRAAF